MRLNKTSLKSLVPKDKAYDVGFDEDGLYARVHPSGKIALHYVYKVGRKRRRFGLGKFPDLSIDKVRTAYAQARACRAGGGDPQVTRYEQREALITAHLEQSMAITFGGLVSKFVAEYSKVNKRSWAQDEYLLRKYILPSRMADLDASNVTRRHLAQLLSDITKSGKLTTANRLRALLSKCCNWGVSFGILGSSPASQLPMNREQPRRRCLNDDELIAFWNGISLLPNPGHQRAVKVLLLTAQRRREIAEIHTDWIEGDWLVIPADVAKNGVAHRVPLTATVRALIGSVKGYAFSGRGSAHLSKFTLSRLVRKVANVAGIAEVRGHDCRRTAASYIEGQCGRDIAHAILNHKGNRLDQTYMLHEYEDEKRQGLRAWEKRIATLVDASPVLNIVKGRA